MDVRRKYNKKKYTYAQRTCRGYGKISYFMRDTLRANKVIKYPVFPDVHLKYHSRHHSLVFLRIR